MATFEGSEADALRTGVYAITNRLNSSSSCRKEVDGRSHRKTRGNEASKPNAVPRRPKSVGPVLTVSLMLTLIDVSNNGEPMNWQDGEWFCAASSNVLDFDSLRREPRWTATLITMDDDLVIHTQDFQG